MMGWVIGLLVVVLLAIAYVAWSVERMVGHVSHQVAALVTVLSQVRGLDPSDARKLDEIHKALVRGRDRDY